MCFSQILKYIPDSLGFSSVCTLHAWSTKWQVEHQRCSRTGLGIYKRKNKVSKLKNTHSFKKTHTHSRKQALVQENTHSFKKKSTRSRKKELVQGEKNSVKKTRSRPRKRPRKEEKTFVVGFLVKSVFSWQLSFFWMSSFFIGRVRVFLNECVFSCFLTFLLFFLNSQPRYIFSSTFSCTIRCVHRM